jgi:hypothetical protein
MHPAYKPLVKYIREHQLDDTQYNEILQDLRNCLCISDLVEAIEKHFPSSPIGFVYQLLDEVQTNQSYAIADGIKSNLSNPVFSFEGKFISLCTRMQWGKRFYTEQQLNAYRTSEKSLRDQFQNARNKVVLSM